MTSIHKLTHHSFIIVISSLQILQFSGGFKAITNSGSGFEKFYVPSCDSIVQVSPGTQDATRYVSEFEYHYTNPKSDLIPADPYANVKESQNEGTIKDFNESPDEAYVSDDDGEDTSKSIHPDEANLTTDESAEEGAASHYPSVNGYRGPYSIEQKLPENLFDGDQLLYPRCTKWCLGFCSEKVVIKSVYDQCLQVTEELNDVIVEGVKICCCSPEFLPLGVFN